MVFFKFLLCAHFCLIYDFLTTFFLCKMDCEIANYADDDHLNYAHHCDIALKTL